MSPMDRKEMLRLADGMDIESTRMKYMADKLRKWAASGKIPNVPETVDKPAETAVAVKPEKFDPLNVELPFLSGQFAAAWMDWCEHRKQKKVRLTPISVKSQLKALGELTEENAIETIRGSITSGWTGLFPPKANGKKPKSFAQQDEERLTEQMTQSAGRLQEDQT
jgi:hypothetical protein